MTGRRRPPHLRAARATRRRGFADRRGGARARVRRWGSRCPPAPDAAFELVVGRLALLGYGSAGAQRALRPAPRRSAFLVLEPDTGPARRRAPRAGADRAAARLRRLLASARARASAATVRRRLALAGARGAGADPRQRGARAEARRARDAPSVLEYELERSRRHNHEVSLLLVRPDAFDERDSCASARPPRPTTLNAVAEAIGVNLRATDVPLRLGAFDFGVILPETPSETARVVGERIRLVGRREPPRGSTTARRSTSPWRSASPPSRTTRPRTRSSIAAAQRALNSAAERGGNRTVLTSAPARRAAGLERRARMTLVRIAKNWDDPDLLRQTPRRSGMWDGIRFTLDPVERCDYLVVAQLRGEPGRRQGSAGARVGARIQEPAIPLYGTMHSQTAPVRPRLHADRASRRRAGRRDAAPPEPPGAPLARRPRLRRARRDVAAREALQLSVDRLRARRAPRPPRAPALPRAAPRPARSWTASAAASARSPTSGTASRPTATRSRSRTRLTPNYWSEKLADCFLAWTSRSTPAARTWRSTSPPRRSSASTSTIPMQPARSPRRPASEPSAAQREAVAEARRLVLERYQLFPFLAAEIRRHEEECAHPAPERIVVSGRLPTPLAPAPPREPAAAPAGSPARSAAATGSGSRVAARPVASREASRRPSRPSRGRARAPRDRPADPLLATAPSPPRAASSAVSGKVRASRRRS